MSFPGGRKGGAKRVAKRLGRKRQAVAHPATGVTGDDRREHKGDRKGVRRAGGHRGGDPHPPPPPRSFNLGVRPRYQKAILLFCRWLAFRDGHDDRGQQQSQQGRHQRHPVGL